MTLGSTEKVGVHSCGACSLCCKVLQVPDIEKPARMICWWTTVHGGCARHREKTTDPKLLACHQFKCLWLESQERPGYELGRIMRPDQSHVVMGPQDREDNSLLYVHVDPDYPDAWTFDPIFSYLMDIVVRGGKVQMFVGDEKFELKHTVSVSNGSSGFTI